MLVSFNPHTHEGCDSNLLSVQLGESVSIHTPTKGVTLLIRYSTKRIQSFNPHTHEGCDLNLLIFLQSSSSFNPHTHEGCDKTCCTHISSLSSFNPHTHEGCDFLYIIMYTI